MATFGTKLLQSVSHNHIYANTYWNTHMQDLLETNFFSFH